MRAWLPSFDYLLLPTLLSSCMIPHHLLINATPELNNLLVSISNRKVEFAGIEFDIVECNEYVIVDLSQ
jgi:hypothetical protein